MGIHDVTRIARALGATARRITALSWWGKVLGGSFGFLLGGPLGALIGAALGHNFDKGLKSLPDEELDGWAVGDRERIQTAFFTATFTVMGCLAKADGLVSKEEIAAAERVMAEMELNGTQRRAAIRLFNEGKTPGFPLHDVLDQFRSECRRRTELLQMFVEIQLHAAFADGELDPQEQLILEVIRERLGLSRQEYQAIERAVRAHYHQQARNQSQERARRNEPRPGSGRPHNPSGQQRQERSRERERVRVEPDLPSATDLLLADAYALLNVSPSASDDEVKKSYRRLINLHHPDKMVSKGLPEAMMKIAERKTHEIKQAYETIKLARKMK